MAEWIEETVKTGIVIQQNVRTNGNVVTYETIDIKYRHRRAGGRMEYDVFIVHHVSNTSGNKNKTFTVVIGSQRLAKTLALTTTKTGNYTYDIGTLTIDKAELAEGEPAASMTFKVKTTYAAGGEGEKDSTQRWTCVVDKGGAVFRVMLGNELIETEADGIEAAYVMENGELVEVGV